MKTEKPKLPIRVKDVIDRIKEKGYTVKITHYRYFGDHLLKNADIGILMKGMKIMAKVERRDFEGYGFIQNKGGKTVVSVISQEGIVYTAESNCSLSDVFVYSKASLLALYRVLDQISEFKDLRDELAGYFVRYKVLVKMGDKWEDYLNSVFLTKDLADREAQLNNPDFSKVVETFGE